MYAFVIKEPIPSVEIYSTEFEAVERAREYRIQHYRKIEGNPEVVETIRKASHDYIKNTLSGWFPIFVCRVTDWRINPEEARQQMAEFERQQAYSQEAMS